MTAVGDMVEIETWDERGKVENALVLRFRPWLTFDPSVATVNCWETNVVLVATAARNHP